MYVELILIFVDFQFTTVDFDKLIGQMTTIKIRLFVDFVTLYRIEKIRTKVIENLI